MTIITGIVTTDVEEKLKLITVANGYSADISVLPGYMVHYAHQLLDAADPLGFPAVAFQPETDSPKLEASKGRSINDHSLRLIGAVDVTNPALVNSKLNSLLYDVRKALLFDPFENLSLAMEIDLGQATFNLPDSQDAYAFFETPLIIKYVEVYK